MAATAKTQQLTLAPWWGWVGVATLFSSAVYRLGSRGIDSIQAGLTTIEWGALVALTVVFVYGEGVLALQAKYLPRLFRRLRELPTAPAIGKVLAPLYAMSLVSAPRPQLLRAWVTTMAIVAAVIVVRAFPEPWRGITDFAVAAALGWATLVLLARGPAHLRGGFPTREADIPGLVRGRPGH